MLIARRRARFVALAAAASTLAAAAGASAPSSANSVRDAEQSTQLISRTPSGGVPNGPSGHAVISGDKRYARVIAFESQASDLVTGDTNGQKDVFVVGRTGKIDNTGLPWVPGRTALVSSTFNGKPADGPSFAPALDGGFVRPSRHHRRRHGRAAPPREDSVAPTCVAFLSAASNIVPGDGNGHVDAFVKKLGGGPATMVSPPGGAADATAVAVSGDCSKVATVVGGRLWVWRRADGATHPVSTPGPVSGISFAVGRTNDLAFATPSGAYVARGGTGKQALVAPGGRNPSYNDLKRKVIAYEKKVGLHWQVFFRELGKPEHVASQRNGILGNGDSRTPKIGNSGFSLSFETDATNLGVNALGRTGDTNGAPDVYLYTDVRKITLLEGTAEKAVPLPGGGHDPSMNYYNNYILFDSPAPIGSPAGAQQVFMRYLGSV